MSYDLDNIFSNILRGEVAAHIVEENAYTLTFMDIMPKAAGHVLVIPKENAKNIFEISDEALHNLITQVQRVARAAQRAYPGKGVRVIQLNGSEAGQSVFHLHFHVIPSNDGMNFGFHGGGVANEATLKHNAALLRTALRALD